MAIIPTSTPCFICGERLHYPLPDLDVPLPNSTGGFREADQRAKQWLHEHYHADMPKPAPGDYDLGWTSTKALLEGERIGT